MIVCVLDLNFVIVCVFVFEISAIIVNNDEFRRIHIYTQTHSGNDSH